MDQPQTDLVELRREKDLFFRTDIDSPLPVEQRSDFKGLRYYPPDKNYRARARLIRFENPKPVVVATSTGVDQAYLRYGTFEFVLKGTVLKLIVFKPSDDPFSKSLFVPFSDDTSGVETYAAGRYLDLEEVGGDDYDLNFNMAYNPYCAYNDQYTCPIPPRENKLPVQILAGEKNYE